MNQVSQNLRLDMNHIESGMEDTITNFDVQNSLRPICKLSCESVCCY